jgi:hypothetical protein
MDRVGGFALGGNAPNQFTDRSRDRISRRGARHSAEDWALQRKNGQNAISAPTQIAGIPGCRTCAFFGGRSHNAERRVRSPCSLPVVGLASSRCARGCCRPRRCAVRSNSGSVGRWCLVFRSDLSRRRLSDLPVRAHPRRTRSARVVGAPPFHNDQRASNQR